MKQVVCNKKDECPRTGFCPCKEPHTITGICGVACALAPRLGATCQPVPTDLFDPLRPPRGLFNPTLHVCDTAKECGVNNCYHQGHPDEEACQKTKYCRAAEARVRCNPVPEPAKPHGVLFAGKARDVMAYLGSLDEKEWEAMMHRGVSIREAKNLKADALRVQGVTEAEYEGSVRSIIIQEIPFHPAGAVGGFYHAVDRAANRIVALRQPS